MRSITGLGLVILIVMSVFGMGISGMMMGMMQMSSPSNLLIDMQNIEPQIINACNKPAGISEVVVEHGEECASGTWCNESEEEEVMMSDVEFVQAPIYPNQFNCMTCSDLIARTAIRSMIGAAMLIAQLKGGATKNPNNFAKSGDFADFATDAGKYGKYGDAFIEGSKNSLKTGKASVQDAAGAGALAAAKVPGASADDIVKLTNSFLKQAGKYNKDLVKGVTVTTVKNSLDDAFKQYNDDLVRQMDNVLAQADEAAKLGVRPDIIDVMGAEAGSIGAKIIPKNQIDDILGKISDETMTTLTKNPGTLAKVGKFIMSGALAPARFVVCGAGGFFSTFSQGQVGAIAASKTMGQKGASVCGVGYVVGSRIGTIIHVNSFFANLNYMQQDINRYTQYLRAIEDQYDIIEGVLNDTSTEIPIGMDQSLFVSKYHTRFNDFKNLAISGMPYSSDMMTKSTEINDILYDILYNKFGDAAYADYYFSRSADVRMSNTLWSSTASQLNSSLKGTTEEDEKVVKLKPYHITAIISNSRIYLERRTETSYPEIHALIVEKYDNLNRNYQYLNLDEAISFLESFDVSEGGSSILGDLEALETQNPVSGQKTTRTIMLEIIEDLKKVKGLITQIEQDEIELSSIQDTAWPMLSDPDCNSEPYKLGDLEIVKSKCAIVNDCNWDHVVDYAFYEGDTVELGDCVNLAVIVNSPVTDDPIIGNRPWRTIPAFKINKEMVQKLLGMLTQAQRSGLIIARPIERMAGGIAFGSVGRAAGAWTDLGQFCFGKGDPAYTMACCIEVANCRMGLCRLCDSITCARPINIEPRLQPGIVVDTTSPNEVKIIGNVGILS